MHLPQQPFQAAEELLKRRGPALKSMLQKQQMELSRQIKETIKNLMTPSYKTAAAQSGQGMDVRQKQVIRTQVTENGPKMFKKASDFLEDELDKLMSCLDQSLEEMVTSLTLSLKNSMQRHAAVGVEREALRELQKACGPAACEALRKSEERQHRHHTLEYSAVEVEVASRPMSYQEASEPSASEPSASSSVPPNEYICPISQEVMKDPVTTCDGHTYDRKSIEEWLSGNNTSPITGLPLLNKTLIPNHSLRKLIQEPYKPHSLEMALEHLMTEVEEGAEPEGAKEVEVEEMPERDIFGEASGEEFAVEDLFGEASGEELAVEDLFGEASGEESDF
eukprot:symbB.v1.2.029141.t1/scaffold3160.1/size62170/1